MHPDEVNLLVGVAAGISNAILAAFMSFGMIGLYQARLNDASVFGSYISNASYWIFLIHFPLVIGVGGAIAVTPFPAGIKYLLTIGIVAPVVFATYHFGVRSVARPKT